VILWKEGAGKRNRQAQPGLYRLWGAVSKSCNMVMARPSVAQCYFALRSSFPCALQVTHILKDLRMRIEGLYIRMICREQAAGRGMRTGIIDYGTCSAFSDRC